MKNLIWLAAFFSPYAFGGYSHYYLSGGATGPFQNNVVVPGAFGVQTANTFLAGPTTGAAANPTFRALVPADLPTLFGTPVSINTTTNATINTTYLCDTSSAGFTVTLPAPVAGGYVIFTDKLGTFSSKNLTIAKHSGEKISGLTQNLVISSSWATFVLFSDGTDWYKGF